VKGESARTAGKDVTRTRKLLLHSQLVEGAVSDGRLLFAEPTELFTGNYTERGKTGSTAA
jgi:hypothetical protein